MRVGVRFDPSWRPGDLVAFARTVENLGYDELWFSEDCFWSGGVAMASAALAVTTRLAVGVGLFATPVRNPATAAMEIATLGDIAPSRFTAAFGHGNTEWMDQIGASSPARLALLEESVSAVRRLLRGETVDVATAQVQLRSVRLGNPPSVPPPVLVGSTGPKGLAVAARSADGVLLPELSTAAAIHWARREAQAAGGMGRLVVFAFLSIDSDLSRATAAVEPALASLARTGLLPRLAEFAGLGADGRGPLNAGTVREAAVVGDAEDCANALRKWEQLGVDTLVLFPLPNAGAEQVARFAADVLPLFRRR
jgi:5,10-methylenetetrahydromethanopterin reductase